MIFTTVVLSLKAIVKIICSNRIFAMFIGIKPTNYSVKPHARSFWVVSFQEAMLNFYFAN